MRKAYVVLCLAVIALALAGPSALAQNTASPANGADQPAQSSLVVGALQIGSAKNLEITGININVATDSVSYSYLLKNSGSAELAIAAAVSLPELQASSDRSETWALAGNDPENPVGLTITAAGTAVTSAAEVHTYALGVDRLAEIKAAHLPLIPFGLEIDKALAALSPEAADHLAALGVVSLRDAAQPGAPMTADWSLDVIRNWRQVLPPGKTTPIVVKFVPVAARYDLAEDDLDDLTDDICLQPQVLRALKSRLKSNGVWKVTDISLASDPPAHWIDSPVSRLAVRKPRPDAIIAFCGMDAKTANQPTVLGAGPDDSSEIRIVIFEPAGK
jgi:hypothetical protein